MARVPRLIIDGEPAVYHVISRTALEGFVLGDVENEYLLKLIEGKKKGTGKLFLTPHLALVYKGEHHDLTRRKGRTGDGSHSEADH